MGSLTKEGVAVISMLNTAARPSSPASPSPCVHLFSNFSPSPAFGTRKTLLVLVPHCASALGSAYVTKALSFCCCCVSPFFRKFPRMVQLGTCPFHVWDVMELGNVHHMFNFNLFIFRSLPYFCTPLSSSLSPFTHLYFLPLYSLPASPSASSFFYANLFTFIRTPRNKFISIQVSPVFSSHPDCVCVCARAGGPRFFSARPFLFLSDILVFSPLVFTFTLFRCKQDLTHRLIFHSCFGLCSRGLCSCPPFLSSFRIGGQLGTPDGHSRIL